MDAAPFSDKEYEIKILLHKPKFQAGISALRKKWSIPEAGHLNDDARNVWVDRIGNDGMEMLKQDIKDLVRSLNYSERWGQAFFLYLHTNNPATLRGQLQTEIKFEHDGDRLNPKNIREVWIKIDADTTEREVRETLKYVKGLFAAPKKRQPPEEFERNIEILELHREGYNHSEIAERLNKDKKYAGTFNSDDVAKIVKRTKKMLE